MKLDQKPLSIKQIKSEMEFYSKLKPELKGLFDLYARLYGAEYEYLRKIEVSVPEVTDEQIEKRTELKTPAMETAKLGIKAEDFRGLLNEIVNVIKDVNPEFEEPLYDLLAYPDLKDTGDDSLPVLMQKALSFDTQYLTHTAKLTPINTELMFFIVYHTVNPFIEKAAYQFRDRVDYEEWEQPECPVCGHKPSMAMLRKEDGARILQCSTCRTWWPYPRTRCAICMTTDQDKLEYFYAKDDKAHLVYVCNNCQKYIKTTDLRETDRDIDLDVEDLATIELDFIAKDRGYTPGGRVTFAINPDM